MRFVFIVFFSNFYYITYFLYSLNNYLNLSHSNSNITSIINYTIIDSLHSCTQSLNSILLQIFMILNPSHCSLLKILYSLHLIHVIYYFHYSISFFLSILIYYFRSIFHSLLFLQSLLFYNYLIISNFYNVNYSHFSFGNFYHMKIIFFQQIH